MTTPETATADGAAAEGYRRLIEIGIALSTERNTDRLMETILLEAKELCNADGGTLYLRDADDGLAFAIMRTDSLDIAMGGTTGKKIEFPPVRIYDPKTGEPNHRNVATHAALTGRTINVANAYETEEFDFSGTKKFDQGTGFRSTSFLTVPLKNHEGDVTGIIQLLNAQDRESGAVVPFDAAIEPLIEALSSQAAVALDNQSLIEAQKNLLDSFIQLIASAIDAKSPYTGGHCQRVPELSRMLTAAAAAASEGPFADFHLDDEERYELDIAALLHDCGKVTTPEYVVDKATKLETIYDRIHEVRMRFEVVKRDLIIDHLKGLAEGAVETDESKRELEARLDGLDADFAFVAECNLGGEFMEDENIAELERIAAIGWTRTLDDRLGVSQEELKRMRRTPAPDLPVEEKLLDDKDEHVIHREAATIGSPDNPFGFKMDVPEHQYNRGEVHNLGIRRGTLTAEERYKINEHIVQTIAMLEALPFPKHLKRVPEYAGGHHETLIGTGYPRKLTKDDMSVPARIMAVADIFEALTAADRPYKPPKTLNDSVRIMSFMVKDQHIDPDLFRLFLESGVYKDYADTFLRPEQIDEVDIAQYLGAAAE